MIRLSLLLLLLLSSSSLGSAVFDESSFGLDPLFSNSLHYPGGVRKSLDLRSYFDRDHGFWVPSGEESFPTISSSFNASGLGASVSVSFNGSRILVGYVSRDDVNYSSGYAVLYQSSGVASAQQQLNEQHQYDDSSYEEIHRFHVPLAGDGNASSTWPDWSFPYSSVALSPGGDIVLISALGDGATANQLDPAYWVDTIESRAGSVHLWVEGCPSQAVLGTCSPSSGATTPWHYAGPILPPLHRFPHITQFGRSVQFSQRNSFIITGNINAHPSNHGVYGGRVFLYQYGSVDSIIQMASTNNQNGASMVGRNALGVLPDDPSSHLSDWPLMLNPYPSDISVVGGSNGGWEIPPLSGGSSDGSFLLQVSPNAVISSNGNAVLAGLPIFHDPNMSPGVNSGPIRMEGRAYVIHLTESQDEWGYLVPHTRQISGHAEPLELRPDYWTCQNWPSSYVREDTTEYWQSSDGGCGMQYAPNDGNFTDVVHRLAFGGAGLSLSEDGSVALVGTPLDDTLVSVVNGVQQAPVHHGSAWACTMVGSSYACSRLTPSLATSDGLAGTSVAVTRDGQHAIVGGNGWYDTYDMADLSAGGVRHARSPPIADFHHQDRPDYTHMGMEQDRPDVLLLSPDNRMLFSVAQDQGVLEHRGVSKCPGHGIPKTGYDGAVRCSCFSGYAGGLCQDSVDDGRSSSASSTSGDVACSAPVWKNLTALQTDFIPEIPAFLFEDNQLRLEILNDLVINRKWTEIRISSEDAYDTIQHDVCAYPGPAWWKYVGDLNDIPGYDGTQPCKERWSGKMPWNGGAVHCFMEEPEAEIGFQEFLAYATIHHHDLIDNYLGTDIYRDTEHVVPLKIRFQTIITLSTDITIYAPINVLAAVIEQTYDASTNTAVLVVAAEVQSPFVFDDGNVSSYPPGLPSFVPSNETLAGGGVRTDDGCESYQENCMAVYTIRVVPNPQDPGASLDANGRVCYLTGRYVLSGTYRCHPTMPQDECPITDATDVGIRIELDITSANFCPQAEIDVGIAGSLTSYNDLTYQTEQDNFFLGSETFYQAKVWLTESVKIANLTIEDVFISYIDPYAPEGSAPITRFLYSIDGGGGDDTGTPVATALGLDMGFQVIPYAQAPAMEYYGRFGFVPRSSMDIQDTLNGVTYPGIPNGLPISNDHTLSISVSARIKIAIEGTMQTRKTTITFTREENPGGPVHRVALEDRQAAGTQISSTTALTPTSDVAVYFDGRSIDTLGVIPPNVYDENPPNGAERQKGSFISTVMMM